MNISQPLLYLGIVLIAGGIIYYFITLKGLSWRDVFRKISAGGLGGATPTLDTFTVDFTKMAKLGSIDPVIGRESEVQHLAQILSRRTKNNAILTGEPGVGKTAIVEALAAMIVSNAVPPNLKNKRMLSLQIASLMAGTKYRGEFEERAKRIIQEISSAKRQIILFIDEVHTVIQSKGTEGAVNFSDILKPALARGDLQMIGATTTEDYEKYIKTDESLERRFQVINVEPPSAEETVKILSGLKEKYEQYHQVQFTDEALQAAVDLSEKYIKDRQLPDKALDAMDEAAAMVKVGHLAEVTNVMLLSAVKTKDPAVVLRFQKIQDLDRKIYDGKTNALVAEREGLESELRARGVLVVDADDVRKVVEDWSK